MTDVSLRTDELSFHRDGDLIRGFGAWQSRGTRSPALILVPDVHGLSDHYRDLAKRFATNGFFTLAIDLYSREGSPSLASQDDVLRWIAELDDRRVLADIEAAAAFLGTRLEVLNLAIGITGYCLGGQYALMSACRVAQIAACASFYGMLRYREHTACKPAGPLDMARDLSCPYLGLFGAEDALIPLADIEELDAQLRSGDKDFEIKIYDGAGHAFCNEGRPDTYRPDAAADSFGRAVRFFRTNLATD